MGVIDLDVDNLAISGQMITLVDYQHRQKRGRNGSLWPTPFNECPEANGQKGYCIKRKQHHYAIIKHLRALPVNSLSNGLEVICPTRRWTAFGLRKRRLFNFEHFAVDAQQIGLRMDEFLLDFGHANQRRLTGRRGNVRFETGGQECLEKASRGEQSAVEG